MGCGHRVPCAVLPPPPTRQGHQHVTTQLLWVGSLHHEALWPSSTAPSAGETLLSCHPASSSPVPRAVTRASPKQLYFGPRRYSSVLLTNEEDGDHDEDLRRAARGMARVSTLLIGKRRATGIGSSRGRIAYSNRRDREEVHGHHARGAVAGLVVEAARAQPGDKGGRGRDGGVDVDDEAQHLVVGDEA